MKRSLTIARKSIFFNFKQYVFFFVALLIVQMFYGIMTISAYNNDVVERASAENVYDYDLTLTHLNESQYYMVRNYSDSVLSVDKYYNVLEDKTVEYRDGGDKYYDIKLRFKEDSSTTGIDKFKGDYYDPDKGTGKLVEGSNAGTLFYMYESPLAEITGNIIANKATHYVISAILLALSIFLMTALYNIRVNQYKFTYGVYMTFGADFKKLFGTSFWEMFMISCITWIPSVIISTVAVFLIYRPSGFAFAFNPLVFIQVFVFSLIVVLVSVFFPMRIMAIRQPMSLIVTQDNSNLVSSPKYSINVFKKKFPTMYELYSSWRFRKYAASTLVISIVFCAFFIMGLYLANIYTTDLNYKRPDFTVNLAKATESYNDEMNDDIYAIDGVEAVQLTGNSIEAREISSHILVDKSDVKMFASNIVTYKGSDFDGSGMRATNTVEYNALNKNQIAMLDRFYNYEGDLNSINDGKTVIIGDSISNIRTFKYKVGDKIYVAVPTKTSTLDTNLTGKTLLREQIDKFKFEYEEFTIGAILTDIPSGNMPIYFSEKDYAAITNNEASTATLSIYIDQNLGYDQVESLEDNLRDMMRGYGNVDVENTYQISKNNVAADKHYNELYICISILLLGISPIMWFFSQTLYYLKRESEFNILQALGAKVREIRQIYIQGGLIMAALSLVVSMILSFLGSYLLFYAYNVVMPYFNSENVRYAFYMPWYALLISLVVSVFCGFFSAYFPYKSYYKNRFTLQNGGGGEYGD